MERLKELVMIQQVIFMFKKGWAITITIVQNYMTTLCSHGCVILIAPK